MNKAKSDLVVIGALLGAHGVRGDVRVKSFTAEPDAIFDYGPLLFENGKEALNPKRARPAKDHFIATPTKPLQKEEWDALKGSKLCISRDMLPTPADDEFYIEDLVGLEVFTGGDSAIGRIKAVLNHGAGDLIEIQVKAGGKPVLIPFTLADVPTVDLGLGRIIVTSFELWADQSEAGEA